MKEEVEPKQNPKEKEMRSYCAGDAGDQHCLRQAGFEISERGPSASWGYGPSALLSIRGLMTLQSHFFIYGLFLEV